MCMLFCVVYIDISCWFCMSITPIKCIGAQIMWSNWCCVCFVSMRMCVNIFKYTFSLLNISLFSYKAKRAARVVLCCFSYFYAFTYNCSVHCICVPIDFKGVRTLIRNMLGCVVECRNAMMVRKRLEYLLHLIVNIHIQSNGEVCLKRCFFE